jgi:hypothetical protein
MVTLQYYIHLTFKFSDFSVLCIYQIPLQCFMFSPSHQLCTPHMSTADPRSHAVCLGTSESRIRIRSRTRVCVWF